MTWSGVTWGGDARVHVALGAVRGRNEGDGFKHGGGRSFHVKKWCMPYACLFLATWCERTLLTDSLRLALALLAFGAVPRCAVRLDALQQLHISRRTTCAAV